MFASTVNPPIIWGGDGAHLLEDYLCFPNGSCINGSGGGGSGTVTSVALSLPAEFSVTGSPVTTAGTLTGAWANESANTVFSGPTTGSPATPAFRLLVSADIPNLSATKITSGQGSISTSTTGVSIGNGPNSTLGPAVTVNVQTASGSQPGLLSAADWTIFNGKQNALSFGDLTDSGTDGLIVTGGIGSVIGSGTSLAQHVSDATHNGYLSSIDWTTFNGKQAPLTFGDLTDAGTDGILVTGGTGAVIGSGTSVAQHVADSTHNGYLTSMDWSLFNGKMDVWKPLRNVYVGNTGYSTVQAAIDFAETLSGSDEADAQGVTVWVPGGDYAETVTINRNVNLRGAGRTNTKISQLEIRPSTDTLAPTSIRVTGVQVTALIIDNQTTPASGVYNTTSLLGNEGLLVKDSQIDGYNIQNALNITFETSELGQAIAGLVSQNTNTILFRNCYYEDEITHTMDSGAAHVLDPTPPLNGTFFLIGTNGFAGVTMNTAGGSSTQSVFEALNSFVGSMTINAGSALAFRDSATFSSTVDPGATTFAFTSLQAYTPTTPTAWALVPVNVDDALDKLVMLQQSDVGVQPTCDAAHRGLPWLLQGAAGVADIYQICQKTVLDTYVWTTH